MSRDYFVEVSKRVQPRKLGLEQIEEASIRYHFLLTTNKKTADKLRAEWAKRVLHRELSEPQGRAWQMIAKPALNVSNISALPTCSFALQFSFTLARPYISKSEKALYIIDNPIVRERVFRLPMVRSTAWKGNLCMTLWQLGHDKQSEEQIQRLFGDVRGEEAGRAGRLFFYPTFFTQTSLEIVNPHDRVRKVGKNPILFECVPAGARGTFSLLYVPFDLIGQPQEACRQAAQDLLLVAKAVQAMMLTYGFSAKRSSGYGVAREKLSDGRLQLRVPHEIDLPELQPASQPPEKRPTLPRYLEAPDKLKPEYLNPDGTFRERSEDELAAMKKADRQLYRKAKAWWEREGKALSQQPARPEAEEPAAPPAGKCLSRDFASFDDLLQKARKIADLLQKGADNER